MSLSAVASEVKSSVAWRTLPMNPTDVPEDAYGNIDPTTTTTSGYAYTGREWDAETGLYYYRARYYDPKVARFISEDPIGFAGGMNFYAYASSNPIRYTDPLGLYNKDVHYELTEQLGIWVGLSPSQAHAIASADQGVDDNWGTSPFIGGTPPLIGWQAREAYHFTTPEKREQMRDEALASGDPEKFGQYLHAFQDSFSHQRGKCDRDGKPYSKEFGHVFQPERRNVDDPRWRPALWNKMVQATIDELVAWQARVSVVTGH